MIKRMQFTFRIDTLPAFPLLFPLLHTPSPAKAPLLPLP
ncbi:hypothetical protein AZE42_08027, partial [Rhizopogon vesiculosus]